MISGEGLHFSKFVRSKDEWMAAGGKSKIDCEWPNLGSSAVQPDRRSDGSNSGYSRSSSLRMIYL